MIGRRARGFEFSVICFCVFPHLQQPAQQRSKTREGGLDGQNQERGGQILELMTTMTMTTTMTTTLTMMLARILKQAEQQQKKLLLLLQLQQ